MYFGSPVASRRLISSARAFCSSVHNPCLSMKPGGLLMRLNCQVTQGTNASHAPAIRSPPQLWYGNQPATAIAHPHGQPALCRDENRLSVTRALQASEQHQNDDDDQ